MKKGIVFSLIKVKSPLIVPYFVPYQHSLLLKSVLRAQKEKEGMRRINIV